MACKDLAFKKLKKIKNSDIKYGLINYSHDTMEISTCWSTPLPVLMLELRHLLCLRNSTSSLDTDKALL